MLNAYQTPEALEAEFGPKENPHDPLLCRDCPQLADIRLDSGDALCECCAYERAIFFAEPFRARYIGTVQLMNLEHVEMDVEEESEVLHVAA